MKVTPEKPYRTLTVDSIGHVVLNYKSSFVETPIFEHRFRYNYQQRISLIAFIYNMCSLSGKKYQKTYTL